MPGALANFHADKVMRSGIDVDQRGFSADFAFGRICVFQLTQGTGGEHDVDIGGYGGAGNIQTFCQIGTKDRAVKIDHFTEQNLSGWPERNLRRSTAGDILHENLLPKHRIYF